MKDHEISQTINLLRMIAMKYHDTQQLRERIAQVVTPILKDTQAARIALANIEHATAPGKDGGYHENAYTLAHEALAAQRWGTVERIANREAAENNSKLKIVKQLS